MAKALLVSPGLAKARLPLAAPVIEHAANQIPDSDLLNGLGVSSSRAACFWNFLSKNSILRLDGMVGPFTVARGRLAREIASSGTCVPNLYAFALPCMSLIAHAALDDSRFVTANNKICLQPLFQKRE